jgi:hypothetical protein
MSLYIYIQFWNGLNTLQKIIPKIFDHFFLANGNADEGWGIYADAGKIFLNFWISISKGEMIDFQIIFFIGRY